MTAPPQCARDDRSGYTGHRFVQAPVQEVRVTPGMAPIHPRGHTAHTRLLKVTRGTSIPSIPSSPSPSPVPLRLSQPIAPLVHGKKGPQEPVRRPHDGDYNANDVSATITTLLETPTRSHG